jgi:hypothetical protein
MNAHLHAVLGHVGLSREVEALVALVAGVAGRIVAKGRRKVAGLGKAAADGLTGGRASTRTGAGTGTRAGARA